MTTGFVRGEANFSTHGFIPIVFSQQVLAVLDVECAAIKCVNTSYEKEIRQFGDIVRVRQFGNILTSPYTAYTNPLPYQTVIENYQDLVIDQQNFWAFLVDYMDIQQSDLDVMGGYADRAAIATRNEVDSDILAHMQAGASAATTFGAPTIGQTVQVTPENIFNRFSTRPYAALYKTNAFSITKQRPFMIVTPDILAVMEDSERLRIRESKTQAEVDTGEDIMTFGHFEVERTTNMPLTAAVAGVSDDYFPIVFGVREATSFAMQVNEVETLSPFPIAFGSAMRGLELHGTKTFYSTATGKIYAKV